MIMYLVLKQKSSLSGFWIWHEDGSMWTAWRYLGLLWIAQLGDHGTVAAVGFALRSPSLNIWCLSGRKSLMDSEMTVMLILIRAFIEVFCMNFYSKAPVKSVHLTIYSCRNTFKITYSVVIHMRMGSLLNLFFSTSYCLSFSLVTAASGFLIGDEYKLEIFNSSFLFRIFIVCKDFYYF